MEPEKIVEKAVPLIQCGLTNNEVAESMGITRRRLIYQLNKQGIDPAKIRPPKKRIRSYQKAINLLIDAADFALMGATPILVYHLTGHPIQQLSTTAEKIHQQFLQDSVSL